MSEKKIYQILEPCLWILNPLLIVLAFYDNQIQPGLFLQWLGKFHPLVLHFPVVFGILIAFYFILFPHRRFPVETENLILAINAFLAGITVLFGLLLSLQNAYDGQTIQIHKWGGLAIALSGWLFIYISGLSVKIRRYSALFFLVVLIVSTHKGAQLTHGVNALNFPQSVDGEKSKSSATVYELGVAPILAQKCISCHGPDKIKGKLQLHSPESIVKGGEDGDILQSDLNQESLLLHRLFLPQTDEKHMPPDGKLQLTTDEMKILSKWAKSGGNFKQKLGEMPKTDSLFILVSKYVSEASQKNVPLTGLPDLKEYNSNYCSVKYLYSGTDEVEVDFYQGSFYQTENLKKLEKIGNQIVSLDMQGMPLTKTDMDIIQHFDKLRKLNLNSTRLDLKTIEPVKTMKELKSLSICGIEFDETSLDKFLDRAKFTSLYVWSNKTGKGQLDHLMVKYPAIKIVVGDNLEDQIMKISNPTIEQDSSIISNHLDIRMKHLLQGVEIRYSTDGSEPDSVRSNLYSKMFRISSNTVLKVKAFKPGWIGSELVQRAFYKSEIHPDTIFLLSIPDQRYRADGPKTLIDYELGGNTTSNGKWLAYRGFDMEFVIGFKEPKELKSAHFNSFEDYSVAIIPIEAINVQGSNDGVHFTKIKDYSFPKASKTDVRGPKTSGCEFPESTKYKFYKFLLTNHHILPAWLPDKGKPAWLYIDELFLN